MNCPVVLTLSLEVWGARLWVLFFFSFPLATLHHYVSKGGRGEEGEGGERRGRKGERGGESKRKEEGKTVE